MMAGISNYVFTKRADSVTMHAIAVGAASTEYDIVCKAEDVVYVGTIKSGTITYVSDSVTEEGSRVSVYHDFFVCCSFVVLFVLFVLFCFLLRLSLTSQRWLVLLFFVFFCFHGFAFFELLLLCLLPWWRVCLF